MSPDGPHFILPFRQLRWEERSPTSGLRLREDSGVVMQKYALVVIASLLASPALAGEAPFAPIRRAPVQPAATRAPVSPAQGTWDINRDGVISDAEIRLGFQHVGTFDRWDLDGNGLLDQEELSAGLASTPLFSNWDRNGDGYLQSSELSLAMGDSGEFDSWDLNDDDRLTRNELYSGLFHSWNGERAVMTRTATTTTPSTTTTTTTSTPPPVDRDIEGEVIVPPPEPGEQVVVTEVEQEQVVTQQEQVVVTDVEEADVYLTRAEFRDGFADLWDRNDDGRIDLNEFRTGWAFLTSRRAPVA